MSVDSAPLCILQTQRMQLAITFSHINHFSTVVQNEYKSLQLKQADAGSTGLGPAWKPLTACSQALAHNCDASLHRSLQRSLGGTELVSTMSGWRGRIQGCALRTWQVLMM